MPDNDSTMPAFLAFGVGRFGLKHDPRGAHIIAGNRLWECVGASYRELPAAYMLDLRSFNREHSLSAPMSACRVLIRTYAPNATR
jgi:hypothetical protein